MLAGTLAFVTGIYCLMQFSRLPSLWLLVILPLPLLLSPFYSFWRKVLLICFIFYLGFCWALFTAYLKTDNLLDPGIENREVFIIGVISSIPEQYDDHIRFLIDIEEITDSIGNDFVSPGRARLSWYKNKVIPLPGEVWQLKVKLKRPYGFMNTGGFDYEAWMLRQDIKATGYIKFDQKNKNIADENSYFIQKLRYKIAKQLNKHLDKPLLGLVMALTLGDRSQLDVEQWKVLTQTGTNHLIAISGLHLGLIAGFIYFLARFVWSRFYFLTQRLPSPIFASIMAFFGAFFYALLSGFALPAQRALIMIAIILIALLQVKQIRVTYVLCITAILILILDPFAITAVDFYLSFMAVIFIVYLTRYRINKHNNFTRWVYLQCLLSFALCPLLIFWFKQIPLYSILANLITIPIVGFLIVPLSLIAMILLFSFPSLALNCYSLIEKLNEIQWSWLEFLSDQKYAVVPIAAPNIFFMFLSIIGVLIVTMPRGLPCRYLGVFFFIPLLFPINEKLNQGEFDFVLLDVGQGLAAVIQTKEHTLVYDTGALFSERFNIGDAVLKPYLRQKGKNNISMLLISHGDNDHIGGAGAIVTDFKVDKILSSASDKITESFPKSNYEACYAGQQWLWEGVNFEILHPKRKTQFIGNNSSCVLKISSKYGSILLTGDIEKEAEASLINRYGNLLQAEILLVPHHGSKTSSTKAFISKVLPNYAFIPTGYKNRFGFPKKDIMSRYDAFDVKTYISYETGELSAKFREKGLQIDEFRTKNRRFWHY
jgi:competence protein ComEC